jgi:ABC-type branched-subunit amino acid transport system permease subunit
VGASRPLEALLFAWALVDLVQVPLVVAIVVSFRLSRRLGRAWKAVAIAFAGYAAWVVVTARFVPYSPSGLAVLLFGMLLDPRRDTTAERVWLLGAAVAAVVFWAVPVALAWRFGRGPRAGRARPPPAR